jgi:hypothetical protein
MPWVFMAAAFAALAAEPTPLPNAHSHNDYAHARPLLDALDQGFCSVEADIFLVDGKLLVGHNRTNLAKARTLQGLYLEPLRERIIKNSGRVYPGGPGFWLLIDLKSEWHQLYPALNQVLTSYSNMLTEFNATGKIPRAVTVVISGDRSREMFTGATVRYAAYDGDLTDLDGGASPDVIPWISANWTTQFKWRGRGAFPEADRQKLQAYAAKTRQQERLLRFWGAPDQAACWAELKAAGVDLINTDNLAGLKNWLLQDAKKQ